MEKIATPAPRRNDLSRTIKVVLSSSLIAGILALYATLLGLLFRTSWLSAFGVSTDLFLPASATELTYWGYMAALFIWGDAQEQLRARIWPLLFLAAGYSAAFFLVIFANKRFKPRINRLGTVVRQYVRGKDLEAPIVTGTVFTTILLTPVVILAVFALLIAIPLIGYSAGQRVASTSIQDYQTRLKQGSPRCHQLSAPSGPIGSCPMIIAQTSERIAYLDGDIVHTIPTGGVTISWQLRR